MAKTAWLERDKRKQNTVKKYAAKRAELKAKKDYAGLAKLPRDASPVRQVTQPSPQARQAGFFAPNACTAARSAARASFLILTLNLTSSASTGKRFPMHGAQCCGACGRWRWSTPRWGCCPPCRMWTVAR